MTPTVILQNGSQWLHFPSPVAVLAARSLEEVAVVLQEVEAAVRSGRHAAGFISYEAAAAFDAALATRPAGTGPLAWFIVGSAPRAAPFPLAPNRSGPPPVWQPELTKDPYEAAAARIREWIASGDTYQVNFSFRMRASVADPRELAAGMISHQPTGWGAFIQTDDFSICSASPELFFRLEGDRIECRPMKGTAPRAPDADRDSEQADALRRSPKNRAENLMIVDMIRNDLGRVARPGSVETGPLFELERHPSVWQMTSTVRARTAASWTEILAALFPSASVTGAPKVRTMQIIRDLEISPRGLYTGTIGWLSPERRGVFNVAIRTAIVESGRAEYGTGSGIVWDSVPADEWEECRAKIGVLSAPRPDFQLLETMRWSPGEGFALLAEHLDRLVRSADYFGLTADRATIERSLAERAAHFPRSPRRVRLRLDRDGRVEIEEAALEEDRRPWRVVLARNPVRSTDVFLHHKTTHRSAYERALAEAPDADDVLLWNERGELTESTRANIALRIGGRWVTPACSCGLLAGTFRRRLIESGELREAVMAVGALRDAEHVRLLNSVRGWIEVERPVPISPQSGT